MTAGSVFLGIALLLAVATYLTYPFWGAQEQERRIKRSKVDLLTEQKEAILAQIRVLDFDFETSKLPEEAHAAQRAQLLAEATAVFQELDALTGVPNDDVLEVAISHARKPQAADPVNVESAIEAAIARARKRDGRAAAPATTPAAATAPAAAFANGQQTRRFCPQCGQAIQAGDKFCAACGHPLMAKTPK